MHPYVNEMMNLFDGCKRAYGIYRISGDVTTTGKVKGNAITIKETISPEIWDKHLTGEQGLGIIPIDEKSQVKFGAVDIDDYDLDMSKLCQGIQKEKLPLVACRTKSGGAHLFMFVNEKVPAAQLCTKLREIASFLGYGNSEIFPKQTKILVSRGDLGQWINMPYFNSSKTMRYAFGDKLQALTLEEFIKYADSKRLTVDQLENLKIGKVPEVLKEGPPCLQILISQGFPTGTRNNGLFNLGVYARKSQPDSWKQLVEQYNSKYMKPPLDAKEALAVIGSLNKKDYNFTCESAPIHSFCNSPVCRTKKYGIGPVQGMPVLGSLRKLCTDPPLWFLDIEDAGTIELNTDDLQLPLKFQKKCMDELSIMPAILKRDAWQAIVKKLLDEVSIIEMPEDVSLVGLLLEYLEEFCNGRVQGKSRDDLLVGKPYLFDRRHYFRLRDFLAYLDRKKFDELKTNKITSILRTIKAKHHFLCIQGKGINCWSVTEFKGQPLKLELPKQIEETPY